MAENKLEREYVIPLRRECMRVARYERTGKAIKTIKKFIAKHMKVADRDIDNVKLDVYFNNDIWFKGRASPPARIKVKAIKEGEIVHVTHAESPEYVSFLKAKHLKVHKKSDKKPEAPSEEVKPEEAKTEEQKTDEKEKAQATAIAHEKEVDIKAKEQKHIKHEINPKAVHRNTLSRH